MDARDFRDPFAVLESLRPWLVRSQDREALGAEMGQTRWAGPRWPTHQGRGFQASGRMCEERVVQMTQDKWVQRDTGGISFLTAYFSTKWALNDIV